MVTQFLLGRNRGSVRAGTPNSTTSFHTVGDWKVKWRSPRSPAEAGLAPRPGTPRSFFSLSHAVHSRIPGTFCVDDPGDPTPPPTSRRVTLMVCVTNLNDINLCLCSSYPGRAASNKGYPKRPLWLGVTTLNLPCDFRDNLLSLPSLWDHWDGMKEAWTAVCSVFSKSASPSISPHHYFLPHPLYPLL